MKLSERFKSETPDFFKKVRTIGIVLASVGGAILASPVALPAALVAAAGYIITAGSVATAVATAVVNGPEK
jgi:hypothetical protein